MFAPERKGVWEGSWTFSQVLWQQKLDLFIWSKSVNMRGAFRDWELWSDSVGASLLSCPSLQLFGLQPFTEENLLRGSPTQKTSVIL